MPLYRVTTAQYEGFQAYFNRHSNAGYMGKHELRSILANFRVKPTGEELQDIIDMISVDSRGITFQCFIDYVASYKALRDVTNEYTEAFRIYDRRGTGMLSRDDISFVMKKLGVVANLDTLFDEVDENRDGYISYKEFCQLMKRQL